MKQCELHSKTEGTSEWEEIIAPFDCSYYAICGTQAGQQFDKCSDTEDANTAVLGLTVHSVMAPPIDPGLPGPRWRAGDPITYVRSSSPLNLYFLK